MKRRLALLVALAAPIPLPATDARAAGLYFSDRGVRPTGRAGAYVAGADDLGAIWYNPAGLADAGNAALVDFAWLRFGVDYTRELLVADADGVRRRFRSPAVEGASPLLPLPTLALSVVLPRDKRWTFAGGFLSPYVALASYPALAGGQPSPARYTLGTFDATPIGIPGAWASFAPTDALRFGLGVFALAGWFQSTVTFSASPQDRLLGAPEQPEFDADAQLRVGPMFAPTANAGVTWVPHPRVRAAVSGQLPMVVDAPAHFTIRMPTAAVFDSARQVGDEARVRFVLPAVIRAGVEVRPDHALRVELSYIHEFWSAHDTIRVQPSSDFAIEGIVGLPPRVKLPPITIPRGFIDSNSIRLGGERRFDVARVPVDVRAGLSFETSAVPSDYVSLSSLDFDKVMAAVGVSVHLGQRWRLDAVYAHLFALGVDVDPATAKIPRINPIKGNAPFEPVNGGRYDARADLLGLGACLRY